MPIYTTGAIQYKQFISLQMFYFTFYGTKISVWTQCVSIEIEFQQSVYSKFCMMCNIKIKMFKCSMMKET